MRRPTKPINWGVGVAVCLAMTESPPPASDAIRRELPPGGKTPFLIVGSTRSSTQTLSKPLWIGLLAGTVIFVSAFLSGLVLYSRSVTALNDEVRGNLMRL